MLVDIERWYVRCLYQLETPRSDPEHVEEVRHALTCFAENPIWLQEAIRTAEGWGEIPGVKLSARATPSHCVPLPKSEAGSGLLSEDGFAGSTIGQGALYFERTEQPPAFPQASQQRIEYGKPLPTWFIFFFNHACIDENEHIRFGWKDFLTHSEGDPAWLADSSPEEVLEELISKGKLKVTNEDQGAKKRAAYIWIIGVFLSCGISKISAQTFRTETGISFADSTIYSRATEVRTAMR